MASRDVTPAQGGEVIRLAKDKGLDVKTFQARVLNSGYLAALFEAARYETLPTNCWQFRKALGLEPNYARREWSVWRQIKNGTHGSVDGLIAATEADGECFVGGDARRILYRSEFVMAPTEVDVELVLVTGRNFGHPARITTRQVYDAADLAGLDKCLAEDGPQLRRVYKDQPDYEQVRVAMESVEDGDHLNVFLLARAHGNGKPFLDAIFNEPDCMWGGDTLWAFRRRK